MFDLQSKTPNTVSRPTTHSQQFYLDLKPTLYRRNRVEVVIAINCGAILSILDYKFIGIKKIIAQLS